MEKENGLKDKYIKLLKTQIEKLDVENFDIEAWKGSAIVIMGRIFGAGDMKVKHLTDLRVDYGSSWSMRAVSGNYDPVESAKHQCREILEVAIHEIELFGDEVISPGRKIFQETLGDKLTAGQLNQLMNITHDDPEGLKRVKDQLKGLKPNDFFEIMYKLLTNLA